MDFFFALFFCSLLAFVVGYLFHEWRNLNDYLHNEKMRVKNIEHLPNPPDLNQTELAHWTNSLKGASRHE